MRDLNITYDVAILGISLYVLGFALGYVYLREKNLAILTPRRTAH
jgi:allophanate hydrolase subunit 1